MKPSADAVAASLKRRLPPPIPGDQVLLEMMSADDAVCPVVVNGKENMTRNAGLVVSTYRVVVVFHDERFDVMEIPCMSIEEVKEPKKASYVLTPKNELGEEVVIVNKLPWDLRVAFRSRRESQGLYNVLLAMKDLTAAKSMPGSTSALERLFAFDHGKRYRELYDAGKTGAPAEDGWELYDVEKELLRQTTAPSVTAAVAGKEEEWEGGGIGTNLRPWFRIAHIDREDEGFSPTYPSRFVVPRSATDKLLRAVSEFRSRQRIPMVSFVHLKSGGVMSRSSQPLPGLQTASSQADEVMCESLLSQSYMRGGTPIPSAYHDGTAVRATATSPTSPAASSPGRRMAPPSLSGAPPSLTGAPPSLTGAPPSLAGAPPSLAASSRRSSVDPMADTSAMKALKEKHRRPPTVIFDARSHIAAQANRGRGGGFETSKHYNCRVVFLNMENIHAVKDSWLKCKKAVTKFNNDSSSARDSVPGPQGPNVGFFSEWEKSSWVVHVQRLLFGACRIVDELLSGVSCLVHCSDGWDRTSQLTSTAMLLIDPYYRTVRGFALLIEKEWCVPGHKFAERSGHQVEGRLNAARFKAGAGNETEEDTTGISKHTKTGSGIEPSPVFLQWMDAVFQILKQHPQAFEFTPALLEFILENIYSCRFGTFLCNFDKERQEEGVKDRTVSLWTEVLRLVAEERQTGNRTFLSETFTPKTGDDALLKITCNGKRMAFWDSFYLKHDCVLHASSAASNTPAAAAGASDEVQKLLKAKDDKIASLTAALEAAQAQLQKPQETAAVETGRL